MINIFVLSHCTWHDYSSGKGGPVFPLKWCSQQSHTAVVFTQNTSLTSLRGLGWWSVPSRASIPSCDPIHSPDHTLEPMEPVPCDLTPTANEEVGVCRLCCLGRLCSSSSFALQPHRIEQRGGLSPLTGDTSCNFVICVGLGVMSVG